MRPPSSTLGDARVVHHGEAPGAPARESGEHLALESMPGLRTLMATFCTMGSRRSAQSDDAEAALAKLAGDVVGADAVWGAGVKDGLGVSGM